MLALVGLYLGSLSLFRAQEIVKAEGRLSLYAGTLFQQIDQFSYLPFVLARDPFIADALAAPSGEAERRALDRRLDAFATRTGLDVVYLMDMTGLTIATSNYDQETSFLGKNFSFRPYFQEAAAGETGTFYGIGTTTNLPGYFLSEPVRDAAGAVLGVVTIKITLRDLERAWTDADEEVLVANPDGVVVLASDPAWRYRTLAALTAEQRAEIDLKRQFENQPLPPLDWSRTGANAARLAGTTYLYLTADARPNGWTVHLFADHRPARTQAWLTVVIAAVVAAAVLAIAQFRDNSRIGTALRRSQAKEVELREANRRLGIEIDERRRAEARLHETQGELARASKLAALGQLAASVTHELGQPIAAMRNHIAAAELSAGGGPIVARLTGGLGGLVERMEAITRQLKFFAVPSEDAMVPVDLRDVVAGARTLVAPNVEASGIPVEVVAGDVPLLVKGNRLRLEQVATNLLRNALDAMADEDVEDGGEHRLTVEITREGANGVVAVLDTGPGLEGRTLDELQEPFVTTRASGHGMGLGLSISTEIVKEHGGTIAARERQRGGARFTVSLPLIAQDADDGAAGA